MEISIHFFFIFSTIMAPPSTIAQSYIVHYDMAEAIKNASESKVVMCEAENFLQYTIRWREIPCDVWGLLSMSRSQFTNKLGYSNMTIMDEKLFPFGVSYALPKNSIYTAK